MDFEIGKILLLLFIIIIILIIININGLKLISGRSWEI